MPYPYGFNTGYQYQNPYQPGPYMPQAQPMQQPAQPQQQMQNQNQAMIWVLGQSAAESYLTIPGVPTPLWDSERQVCYIKTIDANGVPSMRILDYTERTGHAQAAKTADTDFITRKEFEEAISALKPQKKRKEEKEDDA